MSATEWLSARAVELLAALCTGGVLIAGLAVGVPFLRARIAEVFLYSFCCVSAVLVRAGLDLLLRGLLSVARTTHAKLPAPTPLEPVQASPPRSILIA